MSTGHDTEPGTTAAPEPADDLAFVDAVVQREGRGPEALIPILHALQRRYRFLPEPSLRRVCETTGIMPAAVAGVSTFFNQFRLRPMGRPHNAPCPARSALVAPRAQRCRTACALPACTRG